MLGFKFKENFRYPFIATSATEYFQRWHISLNTWLRDYPYRALGGSRGSAFKVYFNIIFLLVLVGMWHGASWNFIFWGLYCGFLLAIQRYMIRNNLRIRIWHPLKVVLCFILFMFGMTFFRAESLTQAFVFLKGMLGFAYGDGLEYNTALYLNSKIIICLVIGYVGSLPVVPWIGGAYEKIREQISPQIVHLVDFCFMFGRLLAILAIFFAVILTLAAETHSPFIYFRF